MTLEQLDWARLAKIAAQAFERASERIAAPAKVETTPTPMFLLVATLSFAAVHATDDVIVEVVAMAGRPVRVEAAILRRVGRILGEFETLRLSPDVKVKEAEAKVKAYLLGLENQVVEAADLIVSALNGRAVETVVRQAEFPEDEGPPALPVPRSQARRVARAAEKATAAPAKSPVKKTVKKTAKAPAQKKTTSASVRRRPRN